MLEPNTVLNNLRRQPYLCKKIILKHRIFLSFYLLKQRAIDLTTTLSNLQRAKESAQISAPAPITTTMNSNNQTSQVINVGTVKVDTVASVKSLDQTLGLSLALKQY